MLINARALGLVALIALPLAAAYEDQCVSPGVCSAPPAKFSKVLPVKPRQQWNTAGGFCGSLSIQVLALTHGAWISEDIIRRSNAGGPCFGHCNETVGPPGGSCHNILGCEVGPENYAVTAAGLGLNADIWDYTQPSPQAQAFKKWIKKHLANEEPVMWAPMCKGDSHTPYPNSCPGGGHFDHHEPLIGIGSNHLLSDGLVHDDDWLLMFSDQDLQTYYRTFSSLDDGVAMDGNCKHAQGVVGKNEMYPCFYSEVAYGMAMKGFHQDEPSLRVFLDVDRQEEPNVRSGQAPVALSGSITVRGLEIGKKYILYRYDGFRPRRNFDDGYEFKTSFVATAEMFTQDDPHAIASSGSTYYIAVRSPADSIVV